MTLDKKLLAQMRGLCAELGPDDGLDPRILRRSTSRSSTPDRKLRQLCGQVSRALSLALAASPDPLLQALLVSQVLPDPEAPGSLRLRVEVSPADPAIVPGEALVRLRQASGWLRAEVALTLARRRPPELSFGWRPPEAP